MPDRHFWPKDHFNRPLLSSTVRILLTADLHLPAAQPPWRSASYEQFRSLRREHQPDAIVVAGDLAVAQAAGQTLRVLREACGETPLAVCLGNHDYWVDPATHRSYSGLDAVRDDFWLPTARDSGITLLDFENLVLPDCVITGGYGHFDLGLADPSFSWNGKLVTRADYLSGGIEDLLWNDFRFIPNCAARLSEEARSQAHGIANRLNKAIQIGKKIIVATHTAPWAELIGYHNEGKLTRFINAYSGNSLVGKVIEAHAGAVHLLVCGHTHARVIESPLHGVAAALNIGTDYGRVRAVLYDTRSGQIQWLKAA